MTAQEKKEPPADVLRDPDIREALFDYLEEKLGKIRIYEEKQIGKSRADVMVVLPDALAGIEIKSDADAYTRLERQVRDYDVFFDYNMLVVGSHHALHAQEHVPDWWGILSVEKTEQGLDFYQVRPWQPNPRLNFINKLGFLWRMELAHIQELNGMYKYADRSKDFVIEKIYASVERPLLARQISDELFERDYTTAAQKIEEYRKEHGRSGRSRRKAGARRRRRGK